MKMTYSHEQFAGKAASPLRTIFEYSEDFLLKPRQTASHASL
jgi:hypothetical protein